MGYKLNPITGNLDLVGMTATEAAAYLTLDQSTSQIITATDVTITASDEIYYGDATDSGKFKKDTVQGILDLVPSSTPDPWYIAFLGQIFS